MTVGVILKFAFVFLVNVLVCVCLFINLRLSFLVNLLVSFKILKSERRQHCLSPFVLGWGHPVLDLQKVGKGVLEKQTGKVNYILREV